MHQLKRVKLKKMYCNKNKFDQKDKTDKNSGERPQNKSKTKNISRLSEFLHYSPNP